MTTIQLSRTEPRPVIIADYGDVHDHVDILKIEMINGFQKSSSRFSGFSFGILIFTLSVRLFVCDWPGAVIVILVGRSW